MILENYSEISKLTFKIIIKLLRIYLNILLVKEMFQVLSGDDLPLSKQIKVHEKVIRHFVKWNMQYKGK
jgi:hypothetical protein